MARAPSSRRIVHGAEGAAARPRGAGILGGRRYTYQWSSMLVLAYFAEGVTRAWARSCCLPAAPP